MDAQLTGSHRSTYDAVFQHPVARTLKWVDVRSMLVGLADSVQEHSGVLKVTRHGKSLILHRPKRNAMGDIGELMKVRHFLEQSAAAVPEPPRTASDPGTRNRAGGKPTRLETQHDSSPS